MDETNKSSKINKTWILIAVLVVVTVILLTESLRAKNSSTNPIVKNEVKKEVAQTSLMFADEARTASVSGTYEMDIYIDSKNNKVTLAQLEMTYDPNKLNKVDIQPGNFIKDPVVIQKSISTAEGRIKYWIGIMPNQKGVSGNGVIATLTFSKPGTGNAQINFLPKTSVSATGFDQSVLKNMASGYIDNTSLVTPKTSVTKSPTNSPRISP